MILSRSYDWYDLPEDVRHNAWSNSQIIKIEKDKMEWLYLPVLWANPNINYCQPYGLLYFPKVFGGPYNNPKYRGKKWFGVRVFSPDDWDHDMDIECDSNLSESAWQEQYESLIKITQEFVGTGSAEPNELFVEIQNQFLKKYPTAKIYPFRSHEKKSKKS